MSTGIDLEKLRSRMRRMRRRDLLNIAERAVEQLSPSKLQSVVGGYVRMSDLVATGPGIGDLLDEVKKFEVDALKGAYYESFDVDSKNCTATSRGTDAFEAEFDRLTRKAIRAANNGPRASVREAFDRLLGLLRRIDEWREDIVFFADEAGSWQVSFDRSAALTGYFRCLADVAPPDEFAAEVDRSITDLEDYDRPRHLKEAEKVANEEQKAALRALKTARQAP